MGVLTYPAIRLLAFVLLCERGGCGKWCTLACCCGLSCGKRKAAQGGEGGRRAQGEWAEDGLEGAHGRGRYSSHGCAVDAIDAVDSLGAMLWRLLLVGKDGAERPTGRRFSSEQQKPAGSSTAAGQGYFRRSHTAVSALPARRVKLALAECPRSAARRSLCAAMGGAVG